MNQPHAHQRPRPWIFALLLLAGPALAFDVEMAPVTVQDTFTTPASTTVTFLQPFDTVPVVVTLATNEGGDPANLRITNVTTTGFTLVVTEPPANDGPHVAMNTAYLAVEPGSHTLPGGGQLQAYTAQTTATVSRFSGVSWDSLVFSNAFPSAPAVLANLQTMNNEAATPPTTSATPFLATAIDNVNASGLQFALERAESTQGAVTVPEVVGIVVMTDGSVTDFFDQGGNPVRLQAARTPDVIRGFSDGCFSVNWPVPFFWCAPRRGVAEYPRGQQWRLAAALFRGRQRAWTGRR
ncbi:MAG: H-type lectin domain-containing protein [Pseudomonadota bacterium]